MTKATKPKASKPKAESPGISLEEMLAKMNPAELNDLLAKGGYKLVAKGIAEEKSSRTAKVQRWSKARELTAEEKTLVSDFGKLVGSGNTELVEGEKLSQSEIDELMKEELCRRDTEDIIKGRYDAIRQTVFNHVTADKGDEFATGEVISMALGHKFVVGKQERGGVADLAALELLVTPEIWDAITSEVTVREVNEDKLTQAMALGLIPEEMFAQIVPAKTVSRTFTVKPLKDGDEVV